jgi:SagB-type dehydrogenase family enzyme
MAPALLLSFRPEVSLVDTPPEEMRLEWGWGQAPLHGLGPGLLAALRTMSSVGATEDDLSDLVLEMDGPSALAPLYYYLQRYGELSLLCYTLVAADQPLATVVPMAGGFQLCPPSIGPDTRFRLSRFAYCRRDGDALVLESPLSLVRTILPGSTGAALVAELAQPRAYPDLCAKIDGLAEETAQTLLSLLANAALVAEVGDDGRLPEDDSAALAQWTFHDLLFHARSRSGRHDYPMGGNFPFLGQIPPLPAVKPKMSDDVIPLYKPEIGQLVQEDIPFTRVLETRRSIRAYGDEAITAQQLGEFLYRVARVRQIAEPDPAHGRPYEISKRPYPSGGASYDLELYVTVNRCAHLAPGLYHYNPLDHQLHKLAERNGHVEVLLRDAQRAVPLSSEPQVLITLASRFQRLAWKYSGLAYALTLKNVGVLYQTMYLVATAMGLAPCGVGSGNSALFAAAVGTDYFAESSVGEFLLGTARQRPMERGAAQPEERVTE